MYRVDLLVTSTTVKVFQSTRIQFYLRENAQENRAKRKIHGHSRKPNLPSFSVYREVLTSLQTSWGLFSEIQPSCEII